MASKELARTTDAFDPRWTPGEVPVKFGGAGLAPVRAFDLPEPEMERPTACYSVSRDVRKAVANSLLSLLLLTTFVWGGCVSCEQYFMFGGAKSCCSPDGHCKTKKPAPPHNNKRDCNQIAFDHQTSVDLHVDLAIVAAVGPQMPVLIAATLQRWHNPALVEPSPPDLQVLHSTFLI